MKKKTFHRILSGVLAVSLLVPLLPIGGIPVSAAEKEPAELKLWYNSEAPNSYDGWEKWSLPIGNSAIGASVFGGTSRERIQLNEKSFWSGGPAEGRSYEGGNRADMGKNGELLKKIQKLFAEGKSEEAGRLCGELIGVEDDAGKKGYGYYLSYGNMYLDFKNGNKQAVDYRRELDLRTAIAGVQYSQNGVRYTRENFVSYPDNVLVTKVTADKPGALSFDLSIQPDVDGNGSGDRTWKTKSENGTLAIDGTVTDNQLKFSSFTKVVNQDNKGSVKSEGDKIVVKDATSVVILTSIGTDYKNDYPKYRTGETADQLSALIRGYVDEAATKDYEALKKAHIDDYQSIFGRVELNLGQQVPSRTTNELLAAYNAGQASEAEKRYLEVLLFQYGRYLTMGSSRKTPEGNPRRETLPSNLQGIWVGKNNSAWHSDYHMNVNLQMNYWPTYSTNMQECAEPLIAYVDSLREPGRKTAEIYAGIKSTPENPENGFMAHTQNNPFGWTCPGWSFDWGWSPAAVPWIIQNCWEYYEYTEDENFLRDKIYPMMREQAILYDQMLVNEKTGEADTGEGVLVSSPSYSPEHGPRTAGNTYEHSLIWQLYEDTIQAAKVLNVDQEYVKIWESKQKRLKGPVQIGDDGQIKEWYEETTLGSVGGDPYGHRHLSHMLGLFPGDLISEEDTELFEAAKVSMRKRTDNSTGWGMGQRINTWARLGEGNKAHKLIGDLFRGGILTNLWDTHAPFQIDGNFGYTSGVAEMLMQSNKGYINLLPALPDVWSSGEVRGLLARGNFEVSMVWKDSRVTQATILSKNGGTATVQFKNAALATVKDSTGTAQAVTSLSNDRISFETVAGETYTFTDIPNEIFVPAPVITKAEKSKADTIELNWDAVNVDGKAVKYNVYRQVERGDLQKIATVDGTGYVDEAAFDAFAQVAYRVSAMVGEVESKLSEPTEIMDLRNVTGKIDNTDPHVIYEGGWGDWRDAAHHNGTIKYLEKPKGGETASLTFVGTGIKVFVARNSDRGKYEVIIDGQSKAVVDTYNPSQQNQYELFKEENLPYEKHTIVLKVLNQKCDESRGTKVELDAFEVLDNTVAKPAEIKVFSASKITVAGAADSQIQMKAEILPAEAQGQPLNWSVSDTSFAEVDENGLVTIKNRNGKVKIIAASAENPAVRGEAELTIAIAGKTEPIVTEIEDTAAGNSKTPNPQITWNGTWVSWDGEPDKHHGGTKTESSVPGAAFEYKFTGTGIEVYAHKHQNFGSLDVYIDDQRIETVSLSEGANDEPQQVIFSRMDLPNQEHTIKCVVSDGNTQNTNLDYLKITTPAEQAELVDKSGLQQEISRTSAFVQDHYPQDRWAVFAQAYNQAVAAMNDLAASADTVNNAKAALTEAAEKLGDPVIKAPSVGDAKASVLLVESSSVYLEWDAVEKATSYLVSVEGGEGQPTERTSFKVSGLTPGETYNFQIRARNGEAVSEDFIAVNGITTEKIDKNGPAPVTNVQKVYEGEQVKLSWTAPEDEDLAGYQIYVNGLKAEDQTGTEYVIQPVEKDKIYVIKIVAYDQEKNLSLPVQVSFRVSSGAVAGDVDAVEKFNPITAAYGTAFDQLGLPGTVKVTLTGNLDAELAVIWSTESYNQNLPGTYMLKGDLQLVNGITNTKNLKAEIYVVVKEDEGIPNPPVQPVDKQQLEAAIWEAERINQDQYEDGVEKDRFYAALAAAREALNNADATQQMVDSAKNALIKAQKQLKKKDTPSPDIPNKTLEIEALGSLEVKKGSSSEIGVRVKADFNSFVRVLWNGKLLSKEFYTAQEGSIIVKLTPDFVKTLAAGSYELKIETQEGYAISTIKVVEDTPAQPGQPSQPTAGDQQAPAPAASGSIMQTGDFNMTGVVVLLLVSLAATVALWYQNKKKDFS